VTSQEEALVGPDEEEYEPWYIMVAWIRGLKLGIEYIIGEEEDEWDSWIILDLFVVSIGLVFNK
jgi:hypothetical protein